MKMLEINTMTREEIDRELEDTLSAYANLRFQKATHQLDNPVKLRYLKKDIARLRTVIREYELGSRTPKKAAEEKTKDKNG